MLLGARFRTCSTGANDNHVVGTLGGRIDPVARVHGIKELNVVLIHRRHLYDRAQMLGDQS